MIFRIEFSKIYNKIEYRTQNTEYRIQNEKVKGGDLIIDYLLLSNDYCLVVNLLLFFSSVQNIVCGSKIGVNRCKFVSNIRRFEKTKPMLK